MSRRTGCAFRLSFLSWSASWSEFFPVITIGPFLHTAVVAVLGLDSPAYSLALWHGFTLPLLMSVIALIGGVTLYAVLHTYMPGG